MTLYIHFFYCKRTRALTFENLWKRGTWRERERRRRAKTMGRRRRRKGGGERGGRGAGTRQVTVGKGRGGEKWWQ
jgi:hypothetical protein